MQAHRRSVTGLICGPIVHREAGDRSCPFGFLAGEGAVPVGHAEEVADEAEERVFGRVAAAVGEGDGPERGQNGGAVLVGDGVLEGAGEADGIRGLGLERLGGLAKLDGFKGRQAVAGGWVRSIRAVSGAE